MSTFTVKLNNQNQGLLDVHPTTGAQLDPSQQRQMYVTGPNGTYRLLTDGEEFEDCNYWKRFAYPQVPYDQAIVEVTSDDGSVYSDNPEENTFPVVQTFDNTDLDAVAEDDRTIDFVGTHGNPATFLQIQNTGAGTITCELNDGGASATFSIATGETQVFNSGDLQVTKIVLAGDGSANTAQVIAAVRSVCNS